MPVAEMETGTAAATRYFTAEFVRGDLLAALKGAADTASARTYKPILACVRLTSGEGGVTVEATNLEQATRWRLTKVQVGSPGVLCVPADKLLKAVNGLPGDTVRLSADETALTVAGKYTHRVNRHDASLWPAAADFPEATGTVAGADLLRLLRQTMPCTAKEATRYAFNGVLFSCGPAKGRPSKLIAVATDGRRLAYSDCPLTWAGEDRPRDAILPGSALGMLAKWVDPDSEVGVWWGENAAVFHGPDWALRTNLLEGQFPPYEDIFPKGCDKRLTADAAALAEAVEQACLLADERTEAAKDGKRGDRVSVPLACEFGPHGFRGHTRDGVAGTESLGALACKWEGEPLTIGFRGDWLAAGVKAAEVPEGGEITLQFSMPSRPALIDRDGYRFVLMPINLNT
jgi:DNA polymerase-3 subunit beta